MYGNRFWDDWGRKEYWITIWEEQLSKPKKRPIGFAWHYVWVLAWERSGGKCERCGRIFEKSKYNNIEMACHCHHIKPLSNGGNSQLGNLIIVCEDCHKELHKNHRSSPHPAVDPNQAKITAFLS